MARSVAVADSPFTIHVSAAQGLDAGLIEACAGRGRIAGALLVTPAVDAARALTRLAPLLGWGTLDAGAIEISGARDVTASDAAAAARLGGAIRAAIVARRNGAVVRGFAGPVFLPLTEPLASIDAALDGIRLDGAYACEEPVPDDGPPCTVAAPPQTAWLARITFPGVVPTDQTVRLLVTNAGLVVQRVEGAGFSTTSRWLLLDTHSRAEVESALAKLARAHRLSAEAWRRLDPARP